MAKVKLDTRLDPEIVERLKVLESRKGVSISDVLSGALDAFEREEEDRKTLSRRVENLESTIGKLVDTMAAFSESISAKFTEASELEKSRLQGLWDFQKRLLNEHGERLESLVKVLNEMSEKGREGGSK